MNQGPSSGSAVALISADFVPTGGMDMPNLELASYLARRGRPVEVIAFRVDQKLSSHPSVKVHTVTKPLNSYFLGAPLLDVTGRRVGGRVLQEGGQVVVNGGNCPLRGLNWVHYVHAAYRPRSAAAQWRRAKRSLEHRVALAGERAALRVARVVVANSRRTRSDLIEHVGIPEERIRVVYYGVDDRFCPPSESERETVRSELEIEGPALAFVGALGDRRKGFDTLMEAWARLGPGWDATLLVVGIGAELPAWKARVTEAGLDNVRFLGFRSDVPKILRAVDGMVAPARYEAFGQAVHEAACCGLPVLVSSGSGVVERLDPELHSLLVTDPDSVSELVARLRRWRDDLDAHKARALRHSAALRQRTWDDMSAEITLLMDRES